jgi:hypothetical protein
MKIYILLISFILISCSVKTNKNSIIVGQEIEKINTDTSLVKLATKNIQAEKQKIWEDKQDSLRNVILQSKSNASLKSSFFQEFYIKGFVNQVNGKIKFYLPFDLHGFDCGAPDCYSTTIIFTIPATNPVVFPKQISFTLLESGCGIDTEISKKGTFEIAEKTSEYINYYSKKERSNLILIGNKQSSSIYYFVDVEPNSIKVNLIDKIINEYDDENPNSIVPYRSTKMLTNEYENFLEN